jgi:hypothetical protein
MKALFLALVVISMSALAAEWRGNTIVLTEQEAQSCARQGGCTVATRAWLDKTKETMLDLMVEVQQAKDAALDAAKNAPRTCRRDTI